MYNVCICFFLNINEVIALFIDATILHPASCYVCCTGLGEGADLVEFVDEEAKSEIRPPRFQLPSIDDATMA